MDKVMFCDPKLLQYIYTIIDIKQVFLLLFKTVHIIYLFRHTVKVLLYY